MKVTGGVEGAAAAGGRAHQRDRQGDGQGNGARPHQDCRPLTHAPSIWPERRRSPRRGQAAHGTCCPCIAVSYTVSCRYGYRSGRGRPPAGTAARARSCWPASRSCASPGYGYRLLETLDAAGFGVDANTLYPLLRRLEKQGLLVERVEHRRGAAAQVLHDEPRQASRAGRGAARRLVTAGGRAIDGLTNEVKE